MAMNCRLTGPILGIYSSQAIRYKGMWPRWSQKTKLAYPSNSSEHCIYIGWGEVEVERREIVIEEVCNQAWPRPQKVPRNRLPRGQHENSLSSPKAVITNDGNRDWRWEKPTLKFLICSSHPLSLRLNSSLSKRLSLNLSKVENSNSVILNVDLCLLIPNKISLLLYFLH